MARIEANATGQIVRLVVGALAGEIGPHPQAAGTLVLDDASNVALLADMGRSTDAWTLVTGVLKKAGVVQAIAPDSVAKQDRDALISGAAQAVADNTAYLAVVTPTNAQVAAQVKILTQQNSKIIKRLTQITRDV